MLLQIDDFYNIPKETSLIMSNLNYEPKVYGHEIENFNAIDENLPEVFSQLLNRKIKIKEDSGIFRKPYEIIHFENFSKNILFVAFIAVEKNVLKTYKHKETESYNVLSLQKETNLEEFIKSDCIDLTKWDVVCEIRLEIGDLIIINPWIWHSLESKTTQVFYLEVENASKV